MGKQSAKIEHKNSGKMSYSAMKTISYNVREIGTFEDHPKKRYVILI